MDTIQRGETRREEIGTAIRRRNTTRKALIEKVLAEDYAGGPVLLEELRWKVLVQQYGPGFGEMTYAKMKSFARTIREHVPDLAIRKISISGRTPVGLVARAAVYRLKNLIQIRQFVDGADPCILCRYQTNKDVDWPRYDRGRYVVAHYHTAAFRFFARRPTELDYEKIQAIPGTFIPATQKLSLIVAPGIEADLPLVTSVPWRLFGYDKLTDWYEVQPTDGLEVVERNRR